MTAFNAFRCPPSSLPVRAGQPPLQVGVAVKARVRHEEVGEQAFQALPITGVAHDRASMRSRSSWSRRVSARRHSRLPFVRPFRSRQRLLLFRQRQRRTLAFLVVHMSAQVAHVTQSALMLGLRARLSGLRLRGQRVVAQCSPSSPVRRGERVAGLTVGRQRTGWPWRADTRCWSSSAPSAKPRTPCVCRSCADRSSRTARTRWGNPRRRSRWPPRLARGFGEREFFVRRILLVLVIGSWFLVKESPRDSGVTFELSGVTCL